MIERTESVYCDNISVQFFAEAHLFIHGSFILSSSFYVGPFSRILIIFYYYFFFQDKGIIIYPQHISLSCLIPQKVYPKRSFETRPSLETKKGVMLSTVKTVIFSNAFASARCERYFRPQETTLRVRNYPSSLLIYPITVSRKKMQWRKISSWMCRQ